MRWLTLLLSQDFELPDVRRLVTHSKNSCVDVNSLRLRTVLQCLTGGTACTAPPGGPDRTYR